MRRYLVSEAVGVAPPLEAELQKAGPEQPEHDAPVVRIDELLQERLRKSGYAE